MSQRGIERIFYKNDPPYFTALLLVLTFFVLFLSAREWRIPHRKKLMAEIME
jgi:hypothetical protein